MTQHVHISRFIASLLIISLLGGCSLWNSWFGREEVHVGEYITLQAEDATEDQGVLWVFSQLPNNSRISGFLPSDTVNLISFVPDVPGEYDITLQITVNGEVEESKWSYSAVVAEDTTLLNVEIPSHLEGTQYAEDTTVSDTPAVNRYTDEGAQRKYLEKIVDPNREKTTASRRSSYKPTRSVRKATTKPSRGNLIPRAARTYTIQVSSWPSLEEAQVASQELQEKYGIDSYVQRAFFKDKDEIYYRLRIGNFQEQAKAAAYAKEVQQQTNLPVWVDYVRKEM